jgi:hypothetical protein
MAWRQFTGPAGERLGMDDEEGRLAPYFPSTAPASLDGDNATNRGAYVLLALFALFVALAVVGALVGL